MVKLVWLLCEIRTSINAQDERIVTYISANSSALMVARMVWNLTWQFYFCY